MRIKQTFRLILLLLPIIIAAADQQSPLTLEVIKVGLRQGVASRNLPIIYTWYAVLEQAYALDGVYLSKNQRTAWKFFQRRFGLELRLCGLADSNEVIVTDDKNRVAASITLQKHMQAKSYRIEWEQLLGPGDWK